MVKEGQFVDAGQVLAWLDGQEETAAQLKQSRAQLQDSQDLYEAETANGQALIREADLAVDRARLICAEEIAAQQAQVRMSEDRLRKAQFDLDRGARLLTSRTISPDEQEQFQMKHAVAVSELAYNKVVLKRLEVESRLRLREAEARVASARAALLRAQRAIQLPTLESQVTAADARWKRMVLTAPVSGQILRIFNYPGEELRSRPLLQMGETQRMYAVAEVYETRVRHVRNNQLATVNSPALGRELTGKVERVGLRIFKNDVLDVDPRADSDSRVVEVRIRLDDSELAAHFNLLQVDVCIDLQRQGVP
jgi:HlyD family secretion protein